MPTANCLFKESKNKLLLFWDTDPDIPVNNTDPEVTPFNVIVSKNLDILLFIVNIIFYILNVNYPITIILIPVNAGGYMKFIVIWFVLIIVIVGYTTSNNWVSYACVIISFVPRLWVAVNVVVVVSPIFIAYFLIIPLP